MCEQVAKGYPLVAVCRTPGAPSTATVYRWLKADPVFRFMVQDAAYDAALRMYRRVFEVVDDPDIPLERREALMKSLKR